MNPGVWIDPLHLGHGALQFDGLAGIKFRGESVMRPRCRTAQEKTGSDDKTG
jgi:hypothetical protein